MQNLKGNGIELSEIRRIEVLPKSDMDKITWAHSCEKNNKYIISMLFSAVLKFYISILISATMEVTLKF